MATKEDVLQNIKTLAGENVLTRDEVLTAFDEGVSNHVDHSFSRKIGFAEILYYLGGAVVFFGIVILVAQNWSMLNIVTKILATLGSGITAYVVGYLLGRDDRTKKIGPVFFLISALVLPIGLYVVFDNAGLDTGSFAIQSIISGILLSVFLLSYYAFRKNLFILFSILYGTLFFFNFTSFLVGSDPFWNDEKFYEYRILITGISYILLGYAFSKGEKYRLSGLLYGFGALGFLGAALALGGWKPEQNLFWELVYPFFVFIVLFFSVYLKSNAFLTFGTIFLMGYILKITSEYFSSGLGWPLALVVAGLSMIGAGYLSLYLKRRFIAS